MSRNKWNIIAQVFGGVQSKAESHHINKDFLVTCKVCDKPCHESCLECETCLPHRSDSSGLALYGMTERDGPIS